MKLETKEIIDALAPFYNGCAFQLIIDCNENFIIKLGCYHLLNLQRGAGKYLQELILNDLEHEEHEDKQLILTQKLFCDNLQEVKVQILRSLTENCRHCGSPLFEQKGNNNEKKL